MPYSLPTDLIPRNVLVMSVLVLYAPRLAKLVRLRVNALVDPRQLAHQCVSAIYGFRQIPTKLQKLLIVRRKMVMTRYWLTVLVEDVHHFETSPPLMENVAAAASTVSLQRSWYFDHRWLVYCRHDAHHSSQ